jgi:hypothetical protein
LNHDDTILTTEYSKTSTERHDIKHQHEYCLVLLLQYCHLGSCTKIFLLEISRLSSFQNMSNDTEHQQVVLTLIDESEKPSSEKVKQTAKQRRPRKNYCTEDYLVGYGVPVLIILLIIVAFVLAFIYIRKYNQNCSYTKGTSCRGMLWYFN